MKSMEGQKMMTNEELNSRLDDVLGHLITPTLIPIKFKKEDFDIIKVCKVLRSEDTVVLRLIDNKGNLGMPTGVVLEKRIFKFNGKEYFDFEIEEALEKAEVKKPVDVMYVGYQYPAYICPECGYSVLSDYQYCSHCGQKLREDK